MLVDGREVCGQWFSGVFWEFKDLPVDLIDKIEIIRGPGATVWGINAINGVINIRTKKAADIEGTTVTAGFETEQRGFGEFVKGDALDNGGNYSIWGRFNTDHSTLHNDDSDSHDAWNTGRIGVRFDFGDKERNYSLLTDYFQGNLEADSVSLNLTELDITNRSTFTKTTIFPASTGFSAAEAANIQFLAGGLLDNGLKWDFNTFFFTRYHDHLDSYGIRLEEDTFALDLRASYIHNQHNLVLGASYRYQNLASVTKVHSDLTFLGAIEQSSFPPDKLDTHQGFIQDTIDLNDDLHLMFGSKFESNEYTGSEWLPGACIWWTGTPNRTLWAICIQGSSHAFLLP